MVFNECYVRREFHHDNLLRWVFLLVDMNERGKERERERENEKNFTFYTHDPRKPSKFPTILPQTTI
ncbi:hypothetical protein TSUD_268400 [Trifolium subterraneum]|uniref:Uncharacterized protein n=1 Tax=Trifolium subterraneum TaxID=3900 RepID=A0A2Z6NU04_TRISU|nr:hypothetical protein TSUD_268400 [Trifolium subterraneum]